MSISNPPNFGSPDWQRGYYSAQKLLAHVAAGGATVTVTLPPNIETLAIYTVSMPNPADVQASGVQSGNNYPGLVTRSQTSATSGAVVLFDVSAALDAQIKLTWTVAPIFDWYVVADSGVRIVASQNAVQSEAGITYAIPTVPGTGAGDHPMVELQYASTLDSPNGYEVVSAAPPGQRVRVFDAYVGALSTATFVALRSSVANVQVIGVSTTAATTSARISGYPSGLLVPEGEGLVLVVSSGNGDATVTYTVETV